jgi:hypothetical protein
VWYTTNAPASYASLDRGPRDQGLPPAARRQLPAAGGASTGTECDAWIGPPPDRGRFGGGPGLAPPDLSARKLAFHPGPRSGWTGRGRPVDYVAAATDVLPPDLSLHATFPAEPAFTPATDDLDVLFRHSGWLRDRRRVYDALRYVDAAPSRLDRFARCGSNAWVIRNEDDPSHWAVVSDHCRDRNCRPCARFRGQVIANNIADRLANRPYRFLTLTIKTTGLTLKQGVDKLYRSFAALRRSRLWQAKVDGGCAICEIKPKADGVGWHPHLHGIIEGRYIPLAPLRALWHRITGDSYIVDVRFGRTPSDAAKYVCKYVTKPFDDSTTRTPHRLHEAIVALTGRRLVTTFGSWRGERLTHYHPSGTWVRVAALCRLCWHARRGDPDALAILEYLAATQPYTEYPRQRGRAPPDVDRVPR